MKEQKEKLDEAVDEHVIQISNNLNKAVFIIDKIRDLCYSAYQDDVEQLYVLQLGSLIKEIEDIFGPLKLFFEPQQRALAIDQGLNNINKAKMIEAQKWSPFRLYKSLD